MRQKYRHIKRKERSGSKSGREKRFTNFVIDTRFKFMVARGKIDTQQQCHLYQRTLRGDGVQGLRKEEGLCVQKPGGGGEVSEKNGIV